MSRQCIQIILLLNTISGYLTTPEDQPQGNFKGYPLPRMPNMQPMQEPQLTVVPPPSLNLEPLAVPQPLPGDRNAIFTQNRLPGGNQVHDPYSQQGGQLYLQRDKFGTQSPSSSANQPNELNQDDIQSDERTTHSTPPVTSIRNSHIFNFQRPSSNPQNHPAKSVTRTRYSHVFNLETTTVTPQYLPPKITTKRRSPRFHWAPSNIAYEQDERTSCNDRHISDLNIKQAEKLPLKHNSQAATATCKWTAWQNNDRPTGRCDCESLPPSCQGGKVDDFQIKTGTGQIVDSIETLRRMNKQVLSFNMDQGVACWNRDQIDSHCTDWMFMDQFQGGPPCCDDYTVRYCCTEGGVQTPEMEMVSVNIVLNLETIVQKVILYRVLQMLVILVPAHNKWEGITVMMDQQRGQQIVKSEERCMFSDITRGSQDIFTTFKLFKDMSDKLHNMTAGGDQHVEPKAYALSEQYEIPGHNLDTENSIIREMCRGNKLYKVQEKQVSQDELKKLDDGKMVAVSAPVTNPRSQNMGGCTSSVTVMTRVTGTHCWYTYQYPDPVTGLSLTFQHQGTATKAVDCCVFGTAPLMSPGPQCWCGQINANTLAQCGAVDISTLTQCGSSTSSPRSHIENWSPDLMAWLPTPPQCRFTVQKMLPGKSCTLVLDIEVLRLGQEEDCQTGGSQISVSIGHSQAAVCGQATKQEGGLVTLSGGQENPLVLAWPANIDTATIMIQRGLPGQMGQKWAFKVMQNC